MKTFASFTVQPDGTLNRGVVIQEGEDFVTPGDVPLHPTGQETDLKGWGKYDGTHPVYKTEAGIEVIVTDHVSR